MHLDLSRLLQVALQLRKRDVLHGAHLLLQEPTVLGREAGWAASAVWTLLEVTALSVLAEHLLDEGLSDTEALGDLSDGVLALLIGAHHALP
jgi:hypothetical protein